MWQLSTGREISLWRSTLRSEGPEPHTGDPQPRVLVLGREVLTKFGVKSSGDLTIWVRWKIAGNPDILLRVACTDSLIGIHSP